MKQVVDGSDDQPGPLHDPAGRRLSTGAPPGSEDLWIMRRLDAKIVYVAPQCRRCCASIVWLSD
jgi:hypothetical protein